MDYPIMAAFLALSAIICSSMFFYVVKIKKKEQLHKIFQAILATATIWNITLFLQMVVTSRFNVDPIIFEYPNFIAAPLMSLFIFYLGIIYKNTKMTFTVGHLILSLPIVFAILIFLTNGFHGLMYIEYSPRRAETIYGPFMMIYNIYAYVYIVIGIFFLVSYSLKNSGFFSKQSVFIILGLLAPLIAHVLFFTEVIEATVYINPIAFGFTAILWFFAMFKFQFLSVAPIALQKINNRMSDGYIVLNTNMKIIDYNATLIEMLDVRGIILRGQDIHE
ncbi:MAG: hypothetical protein FWC68_06300, partial [Oscillospiraceae bacterium]|nr:hypothetical protein [Oscillospiraceae bacterium]